MALSLNGINISGLVSFSKLSLEGGTFEGVNYTQGLPIVFSGSPTTFISTNSTAILPISFGTQDVEIFTSTVQSNLPITFGG